MSNVLRMTSAMLLASVLLAGLLHAQTTGETARGREVYANFCSSCHGQYGRGDGPLVENLAVRPPDFTDPAWLGGRSADQLLAGLRAAPHARMAIASVLKEDARGRKLSPR